MSDLKDFAALSGLEQLQAIFVDKTAAPVGMGATMGFDHFEAEEGRVVFGATPHQGSTTPSAPCTADSPRPCWIAAWAARCIPS
uniref:Uncharacterized protein n=1 Tax=Phenylobacterium glaciei TaxID=2803784 RepID=A0A974P2C3_9CAUL|nr:hypothetical protein JKL49_22960 [Phenylobacterium glaciei]